MSDRELKTTIIFIEISGEAQATIAAAAALIEKAVTGLTPAPLLGEDHSRKPLVVKQLPKRTSHRAEAPAPDLQTPTSNGVTIAGRDISFKGKTTKLTPKEAVLAAALARVMPNQLTYEDLAHAGWQRADELAIVSAKHALSTLSTALEPLGLKVTKTRGIGACMAEA